MENFLKNLLEYLEGLDRDYLRRIPELIAITAIAIGPWLIGVYVILKAPFAILFSR